MQYRFLTAVTVAAAALLLSACASPTDPNRAPAAGAGVYFIEPANGTVVSSPLKVRFGIQGMEVKPAGDQVAGQGHHHLLINLASQPKGEIIPIDDTHIHFGKSQTETDVSLPPGTYMLTMQFADGLHLSYGKQMTATITVFVE